MFYSCEIESAFPPAEAVGRIERLLQPDPGLLSYESQRVSLAWTEGDPPFFGVMNGSSFTARPILRYRNSFSPLLRGTVRSGPTGSKVRVFMRMHAITIVLVLFFTTLSLSLLRSGERAGPFLFVFILLMAGGGFVYEVVQCRRILERALVTPRARRRAAADRDEVA